MATSLMVDYSLAMTRAEGEPGGKTPLLARGGTGPCHERAVRRYMEFQGIAPEQYEIERITDFFGGLEMLRETPGAFLIQCSAHPKVHEITERYWTEVWVV